MIMSLLLAEPLTNEPAPIHLSKNDSTLGTSVGVRDGTINETFCLLCCEGDRNGGYLSSRGGIFQQ